MTATRGSQLGTRLVLGTLLVGALGGILAMDALHRSHLGLGLLMTLGVAGALAEFYALTQLRGLKPMRGLAVTLGALLTAAHGWWLQTDQATPDPAPLLLMASVRMSTTPRSTRR